MKRDLTTGFTEDKREFEIHSKRSGKKLNLEKMRNHPLRGKIVFAVLLLYLSGFGGKAPSFPHSPGTVTRRKT
jgi:hypothetical protein